METKVCRVCKQEKSLDSFYYRKDSKHYRSECKECIKAIERYRKLGVCTVKYYEMLAEQHGRCAICGCLLESSRYTKLAIDHDHRTGKVRGLLCTNCNTGLGLFKDSPVRLEAAISYIKRHCGEDIV